MTVSYVSGSAASNAGTGVNTLSVTTVNVGDLICLGIYEGNSGVTVTGVSGGNAIGWASAGGAPFAMTMWSGNLEIWYATVTAAGPATITVSFAGAASTHTEELDSLQLTNGNTATTWTVDTVGGLNNTTASTTITYPSLAAASGGEAYFGKAVTAGGSAETTGSPATAGFLSDHYADGFCYGLPTAAGAYQPTQTNSASGTSATVGALFIATVGGTSDRAALAAKAKATAAVAGTGSTAAAVAAAGAGACSLTGIGSGSAGGGSSAGFSGGAATGGATVFNPDAAPVTSQAAVELYAALTPTMTGQDKTLGWPLAIFCAAAATMLDPVNALCRDTTSGPGWSQVLDPTRAPTAALPWLGQFVGVAVDPTASDAAQRAQLSAEAGFGRGTLAAITAAAQAYLSGAQAVQVIERVNGDPYALEVIVFGYQVIGTSYARLSDAYTLYADLGAAFSTYAGYTAGDADLTAALQAAKPAGLNLTVTFAGGQLYSDLSADAWGDSYADTTAHYATYAAMTNALPGT